MLRRFAVWMIFRFVTYCLLLILCAKIADIESPFRFIAALSLLLDWVTPIGDDMEIWIKTGSIHVH